MPAISSYVLLHLTMELLGSKAVQSLLGELGNLSGPRLRDAWEEMGEFVASAAVDKAPEGISGKLKAGIAHEIIVEGDDITAIIFSDEPYAPFQERGTPPATTGGQRRLIEGIEAWALDKGYSPFAVARAIAISGLEARKFFEEALIESEDEIVGRVGQVVTEIMEKEY